MKVLHDKGIFSIEGITVINPEVLPITAYVNSVLNLGSLVHNETQNVINDGDFFDLPENIIAEKIQHCDEYHFHGKSSCYVYRLKLKEPLVEDKTDSFDRFMLMGPKQKDNEAKRLRNLIRKKAKEKLVVDTGSKETQDCIEVLEKYVGSNAALGYTQMKTYDVLAAMEEYSSQQLSEYKVKLKAEIEGMMPEEGSCDGDTVLMACKAELEKVLTIIDKIQ